MQPLNHSRTSTGARRAYTLLVITVLLLSVLPAVLFEPAGAQDGTPEAAEQPPAVHTYVARKAVCSPGTILAEADRETLFGQCVEPLENVSFTLAGDAALYPGDTRATQIQPGGPAAFTSWPEVPVGMPYTVTEAIPDGYGEPWVFCEYFLGAPGKVADNTSYAAAPGGRAGYLINDPPYQNVICTWFNVALAEDAQATPGAIAARPQDDLGDVDVGEVEPAGTGRVIVVKHYCPTGFELTLGSYHGYNGDCDIEGLDVSYTLEYGAGQSSAKTAPYLGVGFSQNAQWEDIPAGTVRITEALIEGFATLGVDCTTGPEGTTLPYAPSDDWSPENGWVDYVLQEDYAVRCDWFNVRLPQYDDAGTVTINKVYCPPGHVPPGIGEPFPLNACNDGAPGPDPAFVLAAGGQPGIPPDAQDGGNYVWYGVPGGPLSISEEPPAMYETVAVYCESAEGVDPANPSAAAKAPPDRVEHSGDSLDWELGDGFYLNCIWANAPAEDAYGNLLLIKRLCPEGYTFGQTPLDDLLNDCAEPHAGVQINLVYESGETVQGTTALEGDEAIASFLEVPPGNNVPVSETPPEGYALARVYCTRYLVKEDPVLPSSSNSDRYQVNDNGFQYTISPGIGAACYLFDIPSTDGQFAEAGSVIIYKYLCPPGFAATNPTAGSFLDYCTPEPGARFTVFDSGGSSSGSGTSANGIATVTDISPGLLRISEPPREGYDPPRVFCNTTLAESGVRSDLAEVAVDNWGIPYDLPDGYYLECFWYNLPAAPPPTLPAEIYIHKYACPEATADESQSLEELLDLCTVRPEGVVFRVQSTLNTSIQEKETLTSGDALFFNVGMGSFSVEEIGNQGYAPLTVWCDYVPTGVGGNDHLPQVVVANAINAYLVPGSTLDCYWFNIPYIEPAHLTILKYLCPPDYGIEGAAREDVLFNCTTPVPGIPFEVATDDGSHQSPQFTDSAGTARFEDIPAQDLTISELSHGYDTLRVYCGQVESGSGAAPLEFLELEISGDSVQYAAEPYTEITCYWINQASEYASVHVYKFNCPSDYDSATADRQYFDGTCQDQPADVEFTLTPSSGGPQTSATDAEGQVRWNTLPVGRLELTESPPPGFQVVAVYCDLRPPEGETDPDPGFAETPYDGLLSYDVPPGYELVCEFLNASTGAPPPAGSPTPSDGQPPQPTPADQAGGTGPTGGTGGQTGGQSGGQAAGPTPDPDAPATLIVTKYTCPDDYDLYDPEANPSEDCEELTNDIAFSLNKEGEEPVLTQSTGEDDEGVVTFRDLEPGPYLLTETLPENTQSAFIYTCESDRREFQVENPFVPFAFAGPEGQIGVVLVPGETLACDWLNVPVGIPGAEVTLTKFTCPGAQVIRSTCTLFPDGVTLTLTPFDPDAEEISLTTGPDGTVTETVPEGTYEMLEVGITWCLIDSEAIDVEGHLAVEEDAVIEIRIYNCGG